MSEQTGVDIDVPVVVVGGSMVGLATAMFLAQHGVDVLSIEKHHGTAIHPRAGYFQLRTNELMRVAGIEDRVRAASLALYDPPFVVAAGDPVPPADFTTRLEQLLAADRRSAAVSYYMTAGMGVSVTVVTLLRLTPLWSELKDAAPRLPYEWGARAADEGVPVTAPTLVVAGEQSPASVREAAAALARALPDAQHRLLPAEGDDAALPALARVLEAFFAERTPKAAVPAAA